jgi:predicted alpha/beta-hydrolase family hydrolase
MPGGLNNSMMNEQQASCHGLTLFSYPVHPLDVTQESGFTNRKTKAKK